MFTKEQDGGNMSGTVKEITINTEGIYIQEDEAKHIDVLPLEEEKNKDKLDEESIILDKYNLDRVNYNFDMKIVRALTRNEEQLVDYLDTCRRAQYSNGKIDIPKSIPEIIYDLSELKEGFPEIQDDDTRKKKQIEIYKQAKTMQNALKGKVKVKCSIIDKAYFAVQEFLQNRNKNQVQALDSGIEQDKIETKNKWYNPEYTKKTNEKSREFALKNAGNSEKTVENAEMEK